MSLFVTGMVWRHAPVSDHAALLVLLALADFSNDEGVSWPAIPTIALKTRMSERNVRYVIERLAADGLLIVEGGKGGRAKTNLYTISLQTLQGNKPCKKEPETLQLGIETLQKTGVNPATAIAPEQSGTVIRTVRERKSISLWELQTRAKAIRDRMLDLSDGHLGQKYVGNGPGRTTPYEWTPEGREEYERLKGELEKVQARMASAPADET